MDERFDSHMNQSDTTMWRIEADPSLRTTIVGITILSRAPKWARLRARTTHLFEGLFEPGPKRPKPEDAAKEPDKSDERRTRSGAGGGAMNRARRHCRRRDFRERIDGLF